MTTGCISRLGRDLLGAAATVAFLMTASAQAQTYDQNPQTPQQKPSAQEQGQREGRAMQQQTQRADRPSAIIVGEVLETRNVEIGKPVKTTHRLIKVRAQNGRTAVIDVGNADEYAQISFDRGDRIIAVGKKARINDRPVLFAKSVGELYSVGRHAYDRSSTDQPTGQADREQRGGQQAQGQQAEFARQQQTPRFGGQHTDGSGQTADTGQQEPISLYLFETENVARDDFGVYDEDFYWLTDEPWYADWSDAESAWSNDPEVQYRYGAYGVDDGDWGLWDW